MDVLVKIVGSLMIYLLVALPSSLLLGRFFAISHTEEEG
jgi:hypothetical protein